MTSVQSISAVFLKRNWRPLQCALPRFIPRDSRGGLQTETKSLGYCHLPSCNLAKDALKRGFLRYRARLVSHWRLLSSCSTLDFGALSRSGRPLFAPYHNLVMRARHLHSPHASNTRGLSSISIVTRLPIFTPAAMSMMRIDAAIRP